MSTPNKRKNISIENKYEIIILKSNGTNNKVIAEKYGLSESTISTITNKDEIVYNFSYFAYFINSINFQILKYFKIPYNELSL